MQIQSSSYDVLSKIVKTTPSWLGQIRGQFDGSVTDMFLMLFDSKTVPANATVPVRQWPIYTNAPFGPFDEDIALSTGMVFAVSTTEDALTIATGSNTIDLHVTGSSYFDDSGTTVAGDYTTEVNELTVWSVASGPKTLRRVEVTRLTSVTDDVYLMLFADNTDVADGSRPIAVFPIGGGLSIDLAFNFFPTQQIVGVNKSGCFLYLSSTGETLTQLVGTDYAIKATFK